MNSYQERLEKKTTKKGQMRKLLRTSLMTIVVLIALYILIAPLYPLARYHFDNWRGTSEDNVEIQEIISYTVNDEGEKEYEVDIEAVQKERDDIQGNFIYLPSIDVKMPISEGQTEDALSGGKAWRRPNTSTPDKGGNVVLTGHRFEFLTGTQSFYNLDKLNDGDEILVHWNGQIYAYKKYTDFIVTPEEVSIEAPTAEHRLTLYTCTPIWTATNRLVILAEPIDLSQSTELSNI